MLGAKVITMSANNWIYQLSDAISSIGVEGINKVTKTLKKQGNFSKLIYIPRKI